VQPYHRYEDHWNPGSFRWFPSLEVIRGVVPAVAKNGREVLRDEDGEPVVFQDIDYDTVNSVVAEYDKEPLLSWRSEAPMWFEEHLKIANACNRSVEWRIFSYMGRVFFMSPKHHVEEPKRYPSPPDNVLDDLGALTFVSSTSLSRNAANGRCSRRATASSPGCRKADPQQSSTRSSKRR
jgi:hypothetical protein